MNVKYWALPLGLGLGLAGCNDLLTETPRSQLTTDNFYQSAADARAAIAAAYRPWGDNQLFGLNLQWALNGSSDYARIGPAEENANIINLTRLAYDPFNPYTSSSFINLYHPITRSNVVLERVPDIEMNETQKGHVLGEAKFLRALAYFYLVRLYGDVPLVRNIEEQLANPGRSPAEEVLQQIITDASEAANQLPDTWPAGDRGRATRGSANALLADVYLWRRQWDEAATHAKRVIDSGTYSLMPNYVDAFLPGSQDRSEEVFAAQASDATGAPQVQTAVWYFPRELGPGQTGGWATMVPLDWHLDSYVAGDYRREVSYRTSGLDINGNTVEFAPHVYKYRPRARPGPQDANWPIYRYADVLLMYAEALNELGDQAGAVEYVNMVRARARNGTGSESRAQPADLPVMGQAALRDAIFEERRVELAFEAKRWFDLVRRGQDFWEASLARNPTATDVAPNKMLWPIPQSQIDLNPNLTQNPGYGS